MSEKPVGGERRSPPELPFGSCLVCGTLGPFVVFTNGSFDPLHPRWIGACAKCRAAAQAEGPQPDWLARLATLRDKWREREKKHADYAGSHTASQAIYGEHMGRSREIKACADDVDALLADAVKEKP